MTITKNKLLEIELDIYGANGKLRLSIPKHTHNNRELFRDIKISYDSDWMALHLKSLQSAYRSSPYFEYFEDDFINHIF